MKHVTCPHAHGRTAGPPGDPSATWTKEQHEWERLRSLIIDALDEFPAARGSCGPGAGEAARS